ncbi:hypothetical protein CNEO4_2070001 [Clostridium neonatale]|nr:hypothetical protein CNEO4_2070001 [Clostridium neonatale]CAI3679803.1 hypothetical protein CNEO4_670001 [Clostridium neonatale]
MNYFFIHARIFFVGACRCDGIGRRAGLKIQW